MARPCLSLMALALAGLSGPAPQAVETQGPRGQKAPPVVASPSDRAGGRVLSGRILDGLGRPVPGVTLTWSPGLRREKPTLGLVSTDADGRFSQPLPPDIEGLWVDFNKDGFSNLSMSAQHPRFALVVTLLRKLDWGEVTMLRIRKGSELDAGAREILASEEWSVADVALQKHLFEEQATFRPAIRRLVGDAHGGKAARYWLDMLGRSAGDGYSSRAGGVDPEARGARPNLVDAIKAISRRLNVLSSNPEPRITLDFIAFNPKMDRALVQCADPAWPPSPASPGDSSSTRKAH